VTDTSLWATFSVVDHLRSRPFIADVLLYDRLIVPVPDGPGEADRWREHNRDPDLQNRLLDIVGDLGVRIPWSLARHDLWAQRYQQINSEVVDEGAIRDGFTQAVGFDGNNVVAARRAKSPAVQLRRAEDPDDPALMVTRLVLAEEFGSRKDRLLLAHVPTVDEVEAVAAYGSYSDFRRQRGDVVGGDVPGAQPVFTFEWSFFVPSSSQRSDEDLLREAVDLAHADEVVSWRAALQRWRRDTLLRGLSDPAALEEMEGLIADYRRAARRRKIHIRSRWGAAVAAAGAGVGAVFFPPAGIAAAVCGLGSLVRSPEVSTRLESAAMFHEARKRFS
jgi:hypothetical protein